jgi:hypothetical protein
VKKKKKITKQLDLGMQEAARAKRQAREKSQVIHRRGHAFNIEAGETPRE